jgi:PAS domain S-box-containing protein
MIEKPAYEELEQRVRKLEKGESERKRTQEALLEKETEFRSLTENMNDILWTADLDMNIIYLSPSIEKVLGFTVEERLKQSLQEQMPQESLQLTTERLAEEIESDGERDPQRYTYLEIDYYHKDGSLRCLETALSFIRDEHRKPHGIHGISRDITERKKAEEALREREERYRLLFNMGVNAMFLVDNNTTQILECNNRASQLFGYSSQELLSMKMTDLSTTPEGTRRACQENVSKQERVYQTKDGGLISVDITSEHFYLANRAVHISAIRDITDKKHAEKALRNSEEKHRRLFETMAQGVTYQAADGTIISANPAAERILGLSFEQMQGKTSMDSRWKMILEDGTIVPGTEHPAMIALHIGKTVGPVVRGVFHPEKNTYIWLSITAIPLFQPGETKPFQVYATFEDITLLKEAQDKLQKSHDRIQAIYGALDDAIILVDPITRKVIECNSAIAEIFGYTYKEILGKDTRSLHIDQEHFEKFGREAIAAYADPGYYVTEFEMRRKDGSVFPTENFVRPVLDSNGQIVYVVSVVRDITDRKRLHAQLSQLQKAEGLGRMAGAIAHHFNNQLSVVMGNLELVLDNLPDDAENRENLSQAFEAGHKAAEVSQQMLRYLGHISGTQTTIDLSNVSRKSLALLQSALPSGLTLNVDFPDSGPFVHADAGQIQQVLTNLFTNAQESFPDNKGIIGLVIQTVSYEEIPTSKRFPLD